MPGWDAITTKMTDRQFCFTTINTVMGGVGCIGIYIYYKVVSLHAKKHSFNILRTVNKYLEQGRIIISLHVCDIERLNQ